MDVMVKQRLRHKRGQLVEHSHKGAVLGSEWEDIAKSCPEHEDNGICKNHVNTTWHCKYAVCPLLD